MNPSRARRTPAAAALLLCFTALPAAAQHVTGRVLDGDVLAPVAEATVVALDSALAVVAQTTSDTAGLFAFPNLPAGSYSFQAQIAGRSGAPTSPAALDAHTGPVTLVLPSELFALGLRCPATSRTSALVGLVYERGADVLIPSARVAVYWPGLADSLVATTDATGRYRFCQVPAGAQLDAHVSVIGRHERLAIDVPATRVARADLGLDLGAGASTLAIRSTTSLPDRRGTVVLSGRLVDAGSGAPIDQAVVRLHGVDEPTYSDTAGDFRFERVPPGAHVVEIEHLAYGTQREAVVLAAATATDVEIRLAPQAIVLERIEATGSAELVRAWRASTTRADIVAGRDLAIEEMRGARVADVAKTRFPSLRVSEGRFATRYGLTRGVCMESTRRIISLQPSGGSADMPFCDTISVTVDGVPVGDPVGFLASVTLTDFESVSFMPAMDAGIRFGLAAGGHGGVLILHTRGRGPYVSQERNTPPE